MTPTHGRPKLVSVVALDSRDDSALLALAASLAGGLETPAGTAILESAREREIPIQSVDRFQHTTSAGVAAAVGGRAVVLGNAALFRALGLSIDDLGSWPERLRRRGEQVLFVAIEGRTAGFLGIADTGNQQTHTR